MVAPMRNQPLDAFCLRPVTFEDSGGSRVGAGGGESNTQRGYAYCVGAAVRTGTHRGRVSVVALTVMLIAGLLAMHALNGVRLLSADPPAAHPTSAGLWASGAAPPTTDVTGPRAPDCQADGDVGGERGSCVLSPESAGGTLPAPALTLFGRGSVIAREDAKPEAPRRHARVPLELSISRT